MIPEVLDGLPGWMIEGALLGTAISALVTGLFVVLVRRFPGNSAAGGRSSSGEDRRRAEIRQYLDGIGERYVEDHPVSGQAVAFSLPERDVAITFDARAYYRIARSETTPILVEHELPGVALGPRLPFETPDVDVGVEARGLDPQTAAFEVLDLPEDASTAEIKAAYRERVKDVHPDHGGDRDEFKRLSEAYARAREHAG